MRRLETLQEKYDAVVTPEFEPGVTYEDIFQAYAHSEYGEHHATQRLRWKPFTYEREHMLHDLGDDVHPVRHMKYTHDEILQPMLLAQIEKGNSTGLSVTGIRTLRTTTMMHDTGECTLPSLVEKCGRVVDDIPHFDKVHDDELAEAVIREVIKKEIFIIIPPKMFETIQAIIFQTDRSDYKTKFFRAVEDVGYYQTGINAAEIALGNTISYRHGTHHAHNRLKQLGRMAVIVPNRWRHTLEDRADQYPFINQKLIDTKPILEQVSSDLLRELVVV